MAASSAAQPHNSTPIPPLAVPPPDRLPPLDCPHASIIDPSQALAEMRAAGLLVDDLQFDGKLHRVPVEGKARQKDGAYCAHADAPCSVWWQNWRTGATGVWTAQDETSFSPAERQAFARRMEENRRQQVLKQARRQAETAKIAQRLYADATKMVAHGRHVYLADKGVQSVPGLKISFRDNKLVVPLYDAEGQLVNLQFISEQGEKRFLSGGQKQGCVFFIGESADSPLLISEGLATGLSLHECLGYPVWVAFDAGNLLPVAQEARRQFPNRRIVICADNDLHADASPNTGVEKATAAAQSIDAEMAVPRHEGRKIDWNDLHKKMGAGEVRTQFMNAHKPSGQTPETSQQHTKLPNGYSLRTTGKQQGLWHLEQKDGGEPVETWIGPPLHVLGRTRDQNGRSWGLLLEWQDPDNGKHTWAMPSAILTGRDPSAWLGRLADEGWSGAPGRRARDLLALFLTTIRPSERVWCVPSTGWHYEQFVFPDAIIKQTTGQTGQAGQVNENSGLSLSSNAQSEPGNLGKIVLQTATAQNPYLTGGILEQWQATVGAWAQGNSRLMLAICGALAAPLVHLAGQESGGFNFVGQSSTGKTTALVVGGSAWGKGTASGGYVQNWRATANGLEGMAELHNDALLCLDEIGQASARTISEAAYLLANGMGKARAMNDGSAKAVKSWRCMVLSTGEKGLADKIAEEGGKVQAGQAVRLIDVPADAGKGLGIFENLHSHESPSAFADCIKKAAAQNYGHAARAFITQLQQRRQQTLETLSPALQTAAESLCPPNASGQVRRVAQRFALCAIAGEMATDWGLLPWKEGQAFAAIKTSFDAWLLLRGDAGAAEDAAIETQVRLFIEQHGASRFQDMDNLAAPCSQRVGFRRISNTGEGMEYYVLPESFKSEICKGFPLRRAVAVLLEKGLLLPGDSGSNTRKPPHDLPGFGRKRCYVLCCGGDADALV